VTTGPDFLYVYVFVISCIYMCIHARAYML